MYVYTYVFTYDNHMTLITLYTYTTYTFEVLQGDKKSFEQAFFQ